MSTTAQVPQVRRPDIAMSDYEGWLFDHQQPVMHYFREGRSLCHHWRTEAPWEQMIPDHEGMKNCCETCRLVVDSEKGCMERPTG